MVGEKARETDIDNKTRRRGWSSIGRELDHLTGQIQDSEETRSTHRDGIKFARKRARRLQPPWWTLHPTTPVKINRVRRKQRRRIVSRVKHERGRRVVVTKSGDVASTNQTNPCGIADWIEGEVGVPKEQVRSLTTRCRATRPSPTSSSLRSYRGGVHTYAFTPRNAHRWPSRRFLAADVPRQPTEQPGPVWFHGVAQQLRQETRVYQHRTGLDVLPVRSIRSETLTFLSSWRPVFSCWPWTSS